MGINSNAAGIAEQTSFYETLALVLLILAIFFAVTAIVLCIVLKVPHAIRVLTGMGVDKEIRQISQETQMGNSYSKQSHNKATLTWNTAGRLDRKPEDDETQRLEDDGTALLQPAQQFGKQTYQGDETQLLDPEATTVLSSTDGFEIDNDATTVLGAALNFDSDATTVLGDSDFEIEEEIIITGNQTKGI